MTDAVDSFTTSVSSGDYPTVLSGVLVTEVTEVTSYESHSVTTALVSLTNSGLESEPTFFRGLPPTSWVRLLMQNIQIYPKYPL
jgi:hypothetical protein